MATLITHLAIPCALAVLATRRPSPILFFWACVASLLPDLDVLSFKLGIAYADAFGHRGFSHSVLFACVVGVAGVFFHGYLKATRLAAFGFLFLACASHPLLDALTNGGLGIAFAWPYSDTRYFLPWRIIEVSPIGLKGFLTDRGLQVLLSEIKYVWLPLIALVGAWHMLYWAIGKLSGTKLATTGQGLK